MLLPLAIYVDFIHCGGVRFKVKYAASPALAAGCYGMVEDNPSDADYALEVMLIMQTVG